MVYILIAILIFGFLIFIHELGHFLTAKALDVQVNEFSICMGPAIVKKQRGEPPRQCFCVFFAYSSAISINLLFRPSSTISTNRRNIHRPLRMLRKKPVRMLRTMYSREARPLANSRNYR